MKLTKRGYEQATSEQDLIKFFRANPVDSFAVSCTQHGGNSTASVEVAFVDWHLDPITLDPPGGTTHKELTKYILSLLP